MIARNKDLHGSAPDKCDTALLLIDVINDFAFAEADLLLKFAVSMARRLRALKQRAQRRVFPRFTSTTILAAGSPTLPHWWIIVPNPAAKRWRVCWLRRIGIILC